MCLGCIFRDDVDDAIGRVRAPYRPAGPADHLDTFNVRQRNLLHVPIHAREQRGVHATAVDQQQHRFGKVVLQSANSHRPGGRTDPPYFHPGSKPQGVRKARSARPADIFVGDDVDCGRNLPDLLGLLGRGGDFDLAKLLQGQVLEALAGDGLLCLRAIR
jgi:hypothetical protein